MKKKYFISGFLVLTILFSNTVFSFAKGKTKTKTKTSSIEKYAPQWSEFCPPEYINSVHKHPLQPPEMPTDPETSRKLLAKCPFSHQWFDYNKSMQQYYRDMEQYNRDFSEFYSNSLNIIEGNYWAQRHKDFNREINLCLSNKTTAPACFIQVIQIEKNKTAQRNILMQ
jgi:hypothetical protein